MSGWQHRFCVEGKVDYEIRSSLYEWMTDTFGPRNYSRSTGQARWAEVAGDYGSDWLCFRFTKDFILFKLVWHDRLS